ncbi:MAG: hypothetical protein LBK76_03185 [Verrucomicrobiales bacterium]|jgi:hypothetical protein|nr:hypothetical protein [Verrucomicrobiales bacterium]
MHAPLKLSRPLAITMWDFSWLERRWPGAGYEDWDLALDELAARGYDAVRIDAYPHLVAADGHKTWELLPEWSVQDWGSPARCRVRVLPALTEFIGKCAARNIKVGLSTWFRQDLDNVRMNLADGAAHADIWLKTLAVVRDAGLLDALLYVDLCNEWPFACWAPFFNRPGDNDHDWRAARCQTWMQTSVAKIRAEYPTLPLTYSLCLGPEDPFGAGDLPFFDLLDPHIWMAGGEFYRKVDYNFERFDGKGYENVAKHAEPLYRSNPRYWQAHLQNLIHWHADRSRASGHPLITTECWGIVDYKDWPLLDWGWVKELCALGTETAAATGRWAAIATSNFCGPQFRGMWRDVAWHRRLTDLIHRAELPAEARAG